MITIKKINTSVYFLFISLFLGINTLSIYAQNGTSDSLSNVNSIPLSEITFKYDQLLNDLQKLEEKSQIPYSIIKIDSSYNKFYSKLDSLSNKMLLDSQNLSRMRIKILEAEWESYKVKIYDWQVAIAEHNRSLEAHNDTLQVKLLIWQNSLNTALEKEAPEEILNRITSSLDSIQKTKLIVSNIDAYLIKTQDQLINAQAKVNTVLDYLEKISAQNRDQLFVLDSSPAWNWKLAKSGQGYWEELSTNWSDQKRILIIFLDDSSWQFLFHFITFLVLIWFFHFLQKKYSKVDFPGEDQRIKLAKTSITNPNTSAIIMGLMLSIYHYNDAPDVVYTLLTIVVSIPIILLFPKYISIKSQSFLYFVLAVYILQEIQQLFIIDSLLNRIIQLIKAAVIIYIISIALRNQAAKKDGIGNTYWKWLVKYLAPLFLIISIASIISNVFGAYQLSELLITGVIDACTYAIIFMVFGIIISSVFIIILRSKAASSLKKFTKDNLKFEHRVSGIIYLYILFLWIKRSLTGFQLIDPIINIYNEFVGLFWIVGGVKISIGGILSFVVVLIVTFLLARLIKELINDQVIPVKNSGRGLPNAFSMVIRYMIVTLGVYIALSSAGINLSEFGMVAGALGVGLGFGLQNILHNLVSGLIVSFERPVHVGDTVEVDQLQGVVTEIGVRSSKIRTFDGSEVILPNGNLLSNQVINWTLTDQKRRLEIKIRTNFDANPRDVIGLLKKEILTHDNVLPEPEPLCLFEGYGDSALNFRVLFWVHYNVGLSTKSELALAIYDRLKEKNIEAPIPQQRLLYQNSNNTTNNPL